MPHDGAFLSFVAPPTWAEIVVTFQKQEANFPDLLDRISDAELLMLARAVQAWARFEEPNRVPSPRYLADLESMSERTLAAAMAQLRAEAA